MSTGASLLLNFNKCMSYFLTSESVTEGHPDKLCDQVADAILDEFLKKDPDARVAVEVLASLGIVVVAGEVSSKAAVDMQSVAEKVIKNIGYAEQFGILTSVHVQSPDIARGVSQKNPEQVGAGDQGIMYGYATDETKELMPLPIVLAHALTSRLAAARKRNIIPYLLPDGKAQVTVEYADGKPVRIGTVLVSAQHRERVSQSRIRRDIEKFVIRRVIPKKFLDSTTKILVNPTGRFVVGGPAADTGLTGRKIIVDTYGGVGSHGGGAFSGKDPSKVDRSASYAARFVAKHIVFSKLARRAEVRIAYAIGVPRPLSVDVNTFGTGKIPDERLRGAVQKVFDLRPGIIVRDLQLKLPIYGKTSCYGHFGRTDVVFSWEKIDPKKIRQLLRLVAGQS